MRSLLSFTLALSLTFSLVADCPSCNHSASSWTEHRTLSTPSPLPNLIRNGYTEALGEVIYLRPGSCDLSYVISDPRQIPDPTNASTAWLPQGKDRAIDPDHDWGFRVGLGAVCACYDGRLTYTRLHSTQSFVTLPFNMGGLWPTFAHPATANFSPAFNPNFNGTPTDGIPAFARGSAIFNYDALDLEMGHRSVMRCHLALRSSLTLHFAYIDTTFSDTWQGTEFDQFQASPSLLFTDALSNRSHRTTWGIGPAMGLTLHYPLACGFGFEGHFAGGILAGDRKQTRNGSLFTVSLPQPGTPTVIREEVFEISQHSHAALFPYVDARLGLDYVWTCLCCFTLQLAFGYEFHSYINAIETFRFNDQRGTGQSQCDSFNLNGLYLRVRMVI